MTGSWAHADEDSTIYELKAYVEDVFARLGISTSQLQTAPATEDIFSTALSFNQRSGKRVAMFGIVSRSILKQLDIDQPVFFADLCWNELMKLQKNYKTSFKEIAKYPAVKRDLALLVDSNVQFGDIEKLAFETDRKLLKKVTLFDFYEGKTLLAGKKSYAVSFTLQDETQTLNDKAIDKVMQKLIYNLENKLGAKLR